MMVLYRIVMLHFFFSGVINSVNGEGSGTPLQYSCLENPMDRGALWAAVHEVAKSWSRLRDLAAVESVKNKGEVILFLLCFLPSCKLEFSGALSYLHLVTSVLNKSTYMITNCYIYFLLATCSSAVYSMMLKALWVFRLADASFYLIC